MKMLVGLGEKMLETIRFFIFVALTFITLPLIYVISLFNRSQVGKFRGIWCRFQLGAVGIKLESIGTPSKDTQLYLMNHRSWLDIFASEAIITQEKELENINPCWIGKTELMKNPVVKPFMKMYKMIAVDRENRKGLVKLLRDVVPPIKEKRPLMIFPEGTRNKGDGLLNFKKGAKIISDKNSLKVQPVVYINTDYCFDTRKVKIRTDRTVKAIFLDPVDISNETWFEELRENMLKTYNKHKE